LPAPDRFPVNIGAFLIVGFCFMLGLSLMPCAMPFRELRHPRIAPLADDAATVSAR
jgi:hypothetical protein